MTWRAPGLSAPPEYGVGETKLVSFDPIPAASPIHPVPRNPFRIVVRIADIVAGDPDIASAVPTPVARIPDVRPARGRGRRFNPHRRRGSHLLAGEGIYRCGNYVPEDSRRHLLGAWGKIFRYAGGSTEEAQGERDYRKQTFRMGRRASNDGQSSSARCRCRYLAGRRSRYPRIYRSAY